MTRDALDPGPGSTYPYFPRDAQGQPLWSDQAETDGIQVDGVTPMPRGLRPQGGGTIDVTPRLPSGVPIDPPG